MLFIVMPILALSMAACASGSSAKGLVSSESGFDGAVRVVRETVERGLLIVTVEVPYLDVHGKPKLGQARLMVRTRDAAAGKPIPPLCHVHYEKDIDGAKFWADRGWAVFTSHYDEAHPIDVSTGHSYNQTLATLQWVRRLPFIDRTRLHIDGGSQGGYMALAMSADCFPVSATTADCPVVNWAYNLTYFEALSLIHI